MDETFREGGKPRQGRVPQNLSAGHAASSQALNGTQKYQATKKVITEGHGVLIGKMNSRDAARTTTRDLHAIEEGCRAWLSTSAIDEWPR